MTAKNTNDFVRGAELWQHKLTMLTKAWLWIVVVSLLVGALSAYLVLLTLTTSSGRSIFQYNLVARVLVSLGAGDSTVLARRIDIPDVPMAKLTQRQIADLTDGAYRQSVQGKARLSFVVFLATSFAVAFGFAHVYRRRGRDATEEDFLRGGQLVSGPTLNEIVRTTPPGAGEYSVVGIPIPKGMEMRNFLFTGGMGSGKSVAIFDLAEQVFAAGRKSIVFDKTGEYTARFYRPGRDVILNPFDQRFPGWSIFSELEEVYGFEQMAFSLVPASDKAEGTEQYFNNGARILFAEVLRKKFQEGERKMRPFLDLLLRSAVKDIAGYVSDTKAAAYINPAAQEQAGGVISTLLGKIWFMDHIPDGDFSIKRWLRVDDDARLFINSNERVHDVLLPLFSLYLDLALRTCMSLPIVFQDKFWFFLDEFGSLRKLAIFKESVTQARKFGVVHVLGVQNVAQLQSVFGREATQTIRSNLQNYLLLRVSDEETQEAYSKLIGTCEVNEQSHGVSFGSESTRDGTSINSSRKQRRLVLPSELKLLRDCEGFLQLAGPYPVAKVTYSRSDSESTNQPSYLMRDNLMLVDAAHAASTDDPDAAVILEADRAAKKLKLRF